MSIYQSICCLTLTSVCLSLCLWFCLPLRPPFHPSVHYGYLSLRPSVCPCLILSVVLPVCRYFCLFVCLSAAACCMQAASVVHAMICFSWSPRIAFSSSSSSSSWAFHAIQRRWCSISLVCCGCWDWVTVCRSIGRAEMLRILWLLVLAPSSLPLLRLLFRSRGEREGWWEEGIEGCGGGIAFYQFWRLRFSSIAASRATYLRDANCRSLKDAGDQLQWALYMACRKRTDRWAATTLPGIPLMIAVQILTELGIARSQQHRHQTQKERDKQTDI